MEKLDLKIFPYTSELVPKNKRIITLGKEGEKDTNTLDHLKGALHLFNSELFDSKFYPLNLNKDVSNNPFPLTLVSSVSGKIKNIVFHYPDMKSTESNERPALHKIIKKLIKEMTDVDFFIVANKLAKGGGKIDKDIKNGLLKAIGKTKKNRIHFKEIGKYEYQKFTEWASDTYKAAYDNQGKWYLIEPYFLIERNNTPDGSIFCEYIRSNQVELVKGFICKLIGLSFDGGNILVGDNFVLIGNNVENFNNKRNGISKRKLREAIPDLVNYMADQKMNLLDLSLRVRSFFEDEKDFSELIKRTILFEESNDEFSDSWKNSLVKSEMLEDTMNLIMKNSRGNIKYFFERLLGGNEKEMKKIHFIGKTIKDIDRCHLDDNKIHKSAIRDSIKGDGKKQPIFHLDFFITLAGCSDGKYQLVVGDPVIGLSDKKLASLSPETLGIIFTQICKMNHYINGVLEQMNQIKEPEFKIIRIPLPLTYHNVLSGKKNFKFEWYWASYNNCLVEIDGNSKKVWLPSYSHKQYNGSVPHSPKLKKAWNEYYEDEKTFGYGEWSDLAPHQNKVKKVWNDLGFEAIFIKEDFNWYAQNNGSLACLVNCAKRDIL